LWESRQWEEYIFERFSKFRSGVGRAATSETAANVDRVKEKLVFNIRRITVSEFAKIFGISIGSSRSIFKTIWKMRRISAKFVPSLLNEEDSVNTCQAVNPYPANVDNMASSYQC
jgi:hypothetical protein